ncbi:MAG: S-layer homology domain-containing protein [Oscillospiraceae bacterium]|nr:S-layer homology domain-containing protein [Oscillospiraceae bacterium]MBO5917480.1 S-layer homology domain-containing protein [Oscillospiraceae bacterium]
MKRYMGKLIALLVCAALMLGAAVAAGLADGDSLITKSYLEQIFMPSAVEQGVQQVKTDLDTTYEQAEQSLDTLAEGYLSQVGAGESGGYGWGYERRTFGAYDQINLETGSGVLVEAGRLRLTHEGTVVDVTAGESVPSGTVLTPAHRYLVAEDTHAQLTVESDAARLALEGEFYRAASGRDTTPFTDIFVDDWYREAVGTAYRLGLFAGTGDGSLFAPHMKLDRAMMMTVLFHLAGDPDQERFSVTKTFPDVKKGEWYESYVCWAGEQGISAGYGDGSFQPLKTLTRREVVQFLYNFGISYLDLELAERTDLSAYTGVEVLRADGWGEEAMSWAMAVGVIDRLDPNAYPERAEVAVMVASFAEKYQLGRHRS